jgi:hypothetical protein
MLLTLCVAYCGVRCCVLLVLWRAMMCAICYCVHCYVCVMSVLLQCAGLFASCVCGNVQCSALCSMPVEFTFVTGVSKARNVLLVLHCCPVLIRNSLVERFLCCLPMYSCFVRMCINYCILHEFLCVAATGASGSGLDQGIVMNMMHFIYSFCALYFILHRKNVQWLFRFWMLSTSVFSVIPLYYCVQWCEFLYRVSVLSNCWVLWVAWSSCKTVQVQCARYSKFALY